MVCIIVNHHIHRINIFKTIVYINDFTYIPYFVKVLLCHMIRIHQQIPAVRPLQFFPQPVRLSFHVFPGSFQTPVFHPCLFQQAPAIMVGCEKNNFPAKLSKFSGNRYAPHDMSHADLFVGIRSNTRHLIPAASPAFIFFQNYRRPLHLFHTIPLIYRQSQHMIINIPLIICQAAFVFFANGPQYRRVNIMSCQKSLQFLPFSGINCQIQRCSSFYFGQNRPKPCLPLDLSV